GEAASRSTAHGKAARVFPDPVGATTSVFRPDAIASHAPAWAGVGSANASPNHVRASGENRRSGSGSGWAVVVRAMGKASYGAPATSPAPRPRPAGDRPQDGYDPPTPSGPGVDGMLISVSARTNVPLTGSTVTWM